MKIMACVNISCQSFWIAWQLNLDDIDLAFCLVIPKLVRVPATAIRFYYALLQQHYARLGAASRA
eukprot:1150105-Pelagomonas_calceolata.AAC.1